MQRIGSIVGVGVDSRGKSLLCSRKCRRAGVFNSYWDVPDSIVHDDIVATGEKSPYRTLTGGLE